MKKLIMTALIASMLLVPLGNTALADIEGAPETGPELSQDYLPGSVPAEVSPDEAMSPAIHGMVLALLNHNVSSFSLENTDLTWECLYNMLSLYGQLDWRSQMEDDLLVFPVETVQDYASALDAALNDLPPLPAGLADRLTCDGQLYRAVCGSDGLSQLQVRQVQPADGGLQLTGALVYLPEDLDLVQFQAVLQPRDNMFGWAITALTIR